MRRPVMPPNAPEGQVEDEPQAPQPHGTPGSQDALNQDSFDQDTASQGPLGDDPEPEPVTPDAPGTWAGRWRTLSRLPMTLMISSVLLGLGIVQLTFHLGNSVYRSLTWKQEITQTRARIQNLQRDVNILHDAEKAAQDPAYLEQLARCQGYVRQDESVIVSPQAPTTPGENCQAIRLP